jgi:ketosteroid isomerase-like protein
MDQLTAQNANTFFYQAFQQLSINQMDIILSHGDDSISIHPGWELVIGWMAIKESWIQIFNKIEMIDMKTNTLSLRKCGNLAIFICLENIRISENGRINRSCVLSTNVFEQSKGRWLLSHHQASSISNNLLDIYDS